ncbi:MAG: creatininase family protein [Acidimicrobiia bacterium]|nr:creatininase family protein [Acidimicrobiia bacterium]MDH5504917.1 creatininase family protein [Acidimicrobiia bacterium]
MTKSIYDLVSPDVATVVAESQTAVIPFGSVEQHGPHLPCGTDTMAAEVVGRTLADRLGALYVPFGPYGVTPIHAGHPGTINLRRSTFEALLTDICEELIDMGVTRFVFVNWHEGNIASMDGVATEIQDRHPGVYVVTSHACYAAQRIYAASGGELTHGGGIEVLAVMAHDPALVQLDRAGEATRPDHAIALDEMRRSHETHGYITEVTEIDADGWYGNPTWATLDMAADFAATVADDVAKRVVEIFELRP